MIPRGRDAAIYAGMAVFGAALFWINEQHAAGLPVWAPWEFSPLWYGTTVLSVFWYIRGILRLDAHDRPEWWRQGLFFLGVGAIYTVLQTHFEYLAQHMFFLNRAQHLVMHHLGPLLIAASWPAAPLMRGMPAPVLAIGRWRPLRAVLYVIQQPFVAALLFVGLIALWLVPAIHFRAMLDPTLYTFMNWTMVFDGLLFWFMVLDPRGNPPARASFAIRTIVAVGVMMPQIAIGAIITFAKGDLYAFYEWCGRIYPSIGPIDDQQYGGLIIWIPAAMMSVVALLLVLNAMRRHEEILVKETEKNDGDGLVSSAGAWTGR